MKPIRLMAENYSQEPVENCLTVKEAAKKIGVSVPTLNRWRSDGPHLLPYRKAPGVRGRILYSIKACEDFAHLYWGLPKW